MQRRTICLLLAICGCDGSNPQEVGGAPIAEASPSLGQEIDFGAIAHRVRYGYRLTPAGLTARGQSHVAVAAPGGRWTFQPRARPDEPGAALRQGGELAFETVQLGRSGEPTAAGPVGEDEGTVAIPRGLAEERLENGPDGVEQSFHFDVRPPGAGDLTVRIAVSGEELLADTETGLHFTDRENGIGVRYGAATWVDAKGTRTALRPVFDGGQILLTVPAAVVDASAWPAVLDPFIGTEFNIDAIPMGVTESIPTVARAPNNNNYLVAWYDNRNGTTGIYYVRVNTSGTVLDTAQLAETGDDLGAGVAATYDGSSYLIACASTSGQVHAVRVNPGTGVAFITYIIDNPLFPPVVRRHIAVASNNAGQSLVVYSSGTSPHGVILGVRMLSGGGPTGGVFTIFNDNNRDNIDPSVASDGSGYLVAFNRKDTSAPFTAPQGIYGQKVTSSGALSGSAIGFSGDNIADSPTVSHGDGKYMVAWVDERVLPSSLYLSWVTGAGGGCAGVPVPVGGLQIYSDSGGGSIATPAATYDSANHTIIWGVIPFSKRSIRGITIDACNVLPDGAPYTIAQSTGDVGMGIAAIPGTRLALAAYATRTVSIGNNRVKARLIDHRANGAPCDANSDCASAHCVTGFCCNSACTIANGVGTCAATPGTCSVASCNPGFGDCNGLVGDGCEINTNTSASNCGGCGNACNPVHASSATCAAGTCSYTCTTGWGDCVNGPPNVNGCETDTTVQGNCGSCGTYCSGSSCATGICQVVAGAGVCSSVSDSACGTPFCLLNGGCGFVDADGDGLSDTWEINGYADLNCNGTNDGAAVDLQLPSANKDIPDLYVAYDYMVKSGPGAHSHQPSAAALTQVTQAFAAHGVTLHFLPPAGGITETTVATLDPAPAPACAGASVSTTSTLRAAAIGGGGVAYHYMVFAHHANCPDLAHCAACPVDALCGAPIDFTSTGSADLPGDDVIVAFGSFVDAAQPIGVELEASTIMHELGHNLGLKHGGDDLCVNHKPNYMSVLNYTYQYNGILVADAAGSSSYRTCVVDADCGPPTVATGACATLNACHCTNDLAAVSGTDICYRVDYSGFSLAALNEATPSPGVGGLDENTGVGGPVSDVDTVLYFVAGGSQLPGPSNGSPIDWNNAGGIQTHVAADINNDGGNTLLTTQNDWTTSGGLFTHLNFRYQCTAGYGPGASSAWSNAEHSRNEAIQRGELYPPRQAAIDVRPGCGTNWVLLGSNLTIQVALLGAVDFDVGTVDPQSLRFANGSPTQVQTVDVNSDGKNDLLLDLTMSSLELATTSTSGKLTGLLRNGGSVWGEDLVTIVGSPGPVVTIHDDGSGYSRTLQGTLDNSWVTYNLSDCVDSAIDRCNNPLLPNAAGNVSYITSDESDTPAPMSILASSSFQVRRNRWSTGDGRVYHTYFTVSDAAGNATSTSCRIQVIGDLEPNAIEGASAQCVGACP
jgi:hypothetical protein